MAAPTPPLGENLTHHPYVMDSCCPECQATPGRLATVTDYFLYLRCDRCSQIWTMPERRARKRIFSEHS